MSFWRRLTYWWRSDRHDAALAAEMEDHRARVQADFEAGGLSSREAEAASRRAMGNMRLLREEARDVWILRWADRLWRDARHGLRGLRRERTFTVTATLTLALGVATMTTVFSVADAELWRPLPYAHPERLVKVFSRGPIPNARIDAISGADVMDWRAGAPAFEELASEGSHSRRVLHLETAESVSVTEVTGNYFKAICCAAVAGRPFTTGDDLTTTAVITDRAFLRLFNKEPSRFTSPIGPLRLGADSVVIVGVVRDDGLFCGGSDLFLAAGERTPGFVDPRAKTFFGVVGRLRPGVAPEVARAQVQSALSRTAETHPDGRAGHTIFIEDLREFSTGYNWRPLYFFLGAAVVVLLMSAVNVAALLLGRAFRRTREFALRGALGGGTGALGRQLLVEGLLLAVPAGALGVLVTQWAVGIFTAELPADALTRGDVIPIDLRVVLFALGVTTFMTLLFVLTPLLATRRLDLSGALGMGTRAGRSAREGRARAALLAAQLGLTVILLTGAALFVKSFVALTQVPLGFDTDGTLAMRASLSGPRYQTDDQIRAYAARVLAETLATPGVARAAITSSSPLGSGPLVNVAAHDKPAPAAGQEPRAIIRAASPDYFLTLGIAIARGRSFSDGDVAGAPRVAIVNANLAAVLFGEENPIGRVVDLLPRLGAPWTQKPGSLEVVGVSSNVKEIGVNEVDFGGLYVPFAQMPSTSVEIVARTTVPPAAIADGLRRQAAAIDADMPVASVRTFADRLDTALQGDRFTLILIATFAGVAVLLAGIGIYGAVAYAVQARTRELGIRLALGAHPVRLVITALGQAGRLAFIGIGLGLAGTLALARLIGNALYLVPGEHNGLLFGVTTTDPAMLGAACAVLFTIALVAGAMPARRVARIDPVRALRDE